MTKKFEIYDFSPVYKPTVSALAGAKIYGELKSNKDVWSALRKSLLIKQDFLTLWSDSETDWNAAYELDNNCENFDTAGDTPLKALLKLTIALSEAGELNDQSSRED